MAYSIKRDDADVNLLVVTYEGYWTWEDIEGALTEILKYLDQAEQTLDVISVIMVTDWMPRGITPHLPRLIQMLRHPRCGVAVVVVRGMLPELMIGVMRRTNRSLADRIHAAHTLDAAHEIVHRYRQSHQPPPPEPPDSPAE